MRTWHKLQKTAGQTFQVGGVASSFHRDLDGEAIAPDAVNRAIPGFMANRGPSGIKGGPIRLHHGFWDKLISRLVRGSGLSSAEQMEMIAAVSLPLGRVTEMWVDSEGRTHWKGQLSEANPISKIIWGQLQEGLISLGVSLGGKIFGTQSGARDALGRPCTLINEIRIDELSVTDNPALRLTEGEDTGAYIAALTKSLTKSISTMHTSLNPKRAASPAMSDRGQQWLRKTLTGSHTSASSAMAQSQRAMRATSGGTIRTGLAQGGRGLKPALTPKPKGGGKIQINAAETKTGLGGKQTVQTPPKSKGGREPATDIYGMKVGVLASALAKCANADGMRDKNFAKMAHDASLGLMGITEDPPNVLVNMVKLLQGLAMRSQELPHTEEYRAMPMAEEMGLTLSKALDTFREQMPGELMEKPMRPPGSPGVANPHIAFPSQYFGLN